MRTPAVILGALAALALTGTAAAQVSIIPGANNQFPPARFGDAGQPGRYVADAPPPPGVAPAPAPLLPPLTCGPLETAGGTFRFCARGDGSLILIW